MSEHQKTPTRPDDALPFVTFMETLDVGGLDLARDRDAGRDAVL